MTFKMVAHVYCQPMCWFALFSLFAASGSVNLPIVVNTWPFTEACKEAWFVIKTPNTSAIDAVEAGCRKCEADECDGAVRWHENPDENGESTVDAMIMDGITHNVGSVGALKRVRNAISVARAVLERTTHTMLIGDKATQFAVECGFQEEDLNSDKSDRIYREWKKDNCQPNYWLNVLPNPGSSCGPYKPANIASIKKGNQAKKLALRDLDMIGMVVIDNKGNTACGTSTAGLIHEIPGRVGAATVTGAGCYVDNEVGGATATGDGDILMRFLPSFYAVALMKKGITPSQAAVEAIKKVNRHYPDFAGAVLAVNIKGEHGAAFSGQPEFSYSIQSPDYNQVTVISVSSRISSASVQEFNLLLFVVCLTLLRLYG